MHVDVRHALQTIRRRARGVSTRRLTRVAFWVLALLGARQVVGYGMYLVEAPGEPPLPAIMQHLRDELRTSGEHLVYAVPVTRHVWWTPRETPGILATTERRVIYVGLVPSLLPPPRGDAATPATELASFWLDSVSLRDNRSPVTGIYTIALRARAAHDRFTVAARDRKDAERLLTGVTGWQTAQRAAAARALKVQEEAAELARAPVYHHVKRGEALETIAAASHVPVDSLRRWNQLLSNRIRAGDSLLVRPGY